MRTRVAEKPERRTSLGRLRNRRSFGCAPARPRVGKAGGRSGQDDNLWIRSGGHGVLRLRSASPHSAQDDSIRTAWSADDSTATRSADDSIRTERSANDSTGNERLLMTT